MYIIPEWWRGGRRWGAGGCGSNFIYNIYICVALCTMDSCFYQYKIRWAGGACSRAAHVCGWFVMLYNIYVTRAGANAVVGSGYSAHVISSHAPHVAAPSTRSCYAIIDNARTFGNWFKRKRRLPFRCGCSLYGFFFARALNGPYYAIYKVVVLLICSAYGPLMLIISVLPASTIGAGFT